MKKIYSLKRAKCSPGNENCGGICINPRVKTCRINTPEVKSAISKLFATKPRQLLKAAKQRGFGPVQYITQAEAVRSLAVYGAQANIFDMKSGKATHPYLRINKIEQSAVDKYYDILRAKHDAVKSSKELTLYTRLANAGIRGGNPPMSVENKVKTFIRLYMEQNGQSFATGNPVNLNRLVVDHIIPLSAGGKNTISNMVLIESNINYWKKAKPNQAAMAQDLKNKISLAVPAADLKRYAISLGGSDTKLQQKIRQEILTTHRAQMRALDKVQSREFIKGAIQKKKLLSDYSNLRWAKYNTIESLASLKPKEVRQLLKAQTAESNTVRGWVRAVATKEQVELAKTNVQKAQIFLTNGGKWKDLPELWKEQFKEQYSKNQHKKGSDAILAQYGSLPDAPPWLK